MLFVAGSIAFHAWLIALSAFFFLPDPPNRVRDLPLELTVTFSDPLETKVFEPASSIHISLLPDKAAANSPPLEGPPNSEQASPVEDSSMPDATPPASEIHSAANQVKLNSAIKKTSDRKLPAKRRLRPGPIHTGNTAKAEGGGVSGGGNGHRGAGGTSSVTFWGQSLQVRRIVFVIDRSWSMTTNHGLEIATRELLASIDALPEWIRYQIVFYNDEPRLLGGANELLTATSRSKDRARMEIRTIVAVGGTNHRKAMESALALKPQAILWLTDADDIDLSLVRAITAENARSKIAIHILHLRHNSPELPEIAIESLAQRNFGQYRAIDTNTFRFRR